MEKKQQHIGNLPKDEPRANSRNSNTDETIERVYEKNEEMFDSENRYYEDDSSHDAMKKML